MDGVAPRGARGGAGVRRLFLGRRQMRRPDRASSSRGVRGRRGSRRRSWASWRGR